MRYLRQSTSVDVPIGPFVDATDGFTAETALTITQPDVRLKKNDAAWAQKAAAQTLSHEENGFYEVTLDATDANTLGLLRLAVAESGARIVTEDFMVMPAEVWDALFGTGIAEPTAVFTWPAPWPKVLGWIGAIMRNKMTQSGATQTLRNDADGADIATSATTDAGGVTTKGEWT